jgi:spoIIIJ-associated protein
MESTETSGRTVEDALERALAQLGARREDVDYVVLDEGKRGGLFGRGGREASVRVTRRPAGDPGERPSEPADTRIPHAPAASAPARRGNRDRDRGGRSRGARPAGERLGFEAPQPTLREEDFIRPRADGGASRPDNRFQDDRSRPTRGDRRRSDRPRSGPQRPSRPRDDRPRERDDRLEVEPDINAEEVDVAATVIDDLLRVLDITADITIREPLTAGDGKGSVRAVIDLNGRGLGLLIGRRGDTLVALQYLVNSIVTHRFPGRSGVTIDIEHYRHRREEQVSSLAQRMADRVRQTGNPITLEPMTPNERRLIHIMFADDQEIMTNSVGEGENRKVVISRRHEEH